MRARALFLAVSSVSPAMLGCGGGEAASGSMTQPCPTAAELDDGNPCTTDACDEATGEVSHAGISGCTIEIAAAGAPSPRRRHSAVWSGSEMIVWGGSVAGTPPVTGSGGRYNLVAGAWEPVSMGGAPAPRHSHCAAWTGEAMIVWGGYGVSSAEITGGLYDPKSDTWKAMSTAGAPSGRTGFTCVWTGSELIVWGGNSGGNLVGDGGRYDPAKDTWSAIPAAGAPSPRYGHSAVWTGKAMMIWGGNDLFDWHADGALFDPSSGTWTAMATAGAPPAREAATAAWTGEAAVIWGGWTGGPYAGDGAVYAPSGAGSWTTMAASGAPSPRQDHVGLMTASGFVVWGGCGNDLCKDVYGDGAVWSAGAGGGSWRGMMSSALAARRGATAVEVSGGAAIWGGKTAAGETDTGAILYP